LGRYWGSKNFPHPSLKTEIDDFRNYSFTTILMYIDMLYTYIPHSVDVQPNLHLPEDETVHTLDINNMTT